MTEHDLRRCHRVALHLQSNRCRRERPVERLLLPNLVSRVLHARPGSESPSGFRSGRARFRESSRSTERRRTSPARLPRLPVADTSFTFAPSATSAGPRLEALTKYAGPAAEDRVIPVLARLDQALAVLHAEQPLPAAVIPAARPLAEVAAHRSHVADLRAGDAANRLTRATGTRSGSQRCSPDSSNVDQPRRCAGRRLALRDAAKLLDALDVHDPLRASRRSPSSG